jgi:hypothetical protein
MPVIMHMVVVVALAIFWGGYVASKLWCWFLVPLGLPCITYLHAAGIALLLEVLLGSRGISLHSAEHAPEKIKKFALTCAIAVPGFGLLLGWLVHALM